MLQPKFIQYIDEQVSNNRRLRYVLTTESIYENDPFIILADDTFGHNTFADHPHAGIQTVTYVVEGSVSHYDSKNNKGTLYVGDFQMMTAGKGIIHNENPKRGETVRVLQLWVNLNAAHKKVDGSYEDLRQKDAPVVSFEGGQAQVYAGTFETVQSPLKLYTPYVYVVLQLQAGTIYQFGTERKFNHYMYVLQGDAQIGEETVQAHQFITFGYYEEAQTIAIKANTAVTLVYFAGEPIREPIVAQGPFVMNTKEEIHEKIKSFQQGTFD